MGVPQQPLRPVGAVEGMAPAMTVPDKHLLDSVAAMTPGRILRLLYEAAGGSDGAAVAVHLLGGQVLTGRLISVATDQGHEVAVLYDPRIGSLGYVLTAHVIAVEVVHPEPFTDVITGGRLPAPGEDGDDGEDGEDSEDGETSRQ